MCIIIDASKFGDFHNNKNVDMKRIKEWIEEKGKLAYVGTGQFKREYDKSTKMRDILQEYYRGGLLKEANPDEYNAKVEELSKETLQSDDEHILALAIVANVKLLVSADKKLIMDFTRLVKGDTYETYKEHKGLLEKHSCP